MVTNESELNTHIRRQTNEWSFAAIPIMVCLVFAFAGREQIHAQELAPTTQIVAVSDGVPPVDRGLRPYFEEPIINEGGQVAFEGFWVEGEEFGDPTREGIVYRSDGKGGLIEVAQIGGDAPVGGVWITAGIWALDDTGRVAFAGTTSKPDGTNEQGHFYGNGVDPLTVVAVEGQTLSSGDTVESSGIIDMDNSGRAVLNGDLSLAEGPSSLTAAFLFDPESGLQVIAHEDQVPPGRGGVFSSVVPTPAINGSGVVQFSPRVDLPGNRFENPIYHISASEAATLITVTGDALPGGGTVGLIRFSPTLNDAGQAAFIGTVSGATDGFGDGEGLFLADGKAPIKTVVRAGQPAPDGNGNFELFGRNSPNGRGQIAFGTIFVNTAGGADDDVAIVRGDSDGTLKIIARRGQMVPGSSSARFLFSRVKRTSPQGVVSIQNGREASINDLGQVIFQADYAEVGSEEVTGSGFFFYDDNFGLVAVAKPGDALLGSALAEVALKRNIHVESARADGVNNCGEVAYRFVLVDGREGVAIWDPGFSKTRAGPRDIAISVDDSGKVIVEWKAPADLSQTIESSYSLEIESWQEASTPPLYLQGESWRWEGTVSDDQHRYFRLRW